MSPALCNIVEICCTVQHVTCCTGHMLKSATCDYGQRHVIAFRPISVAAHSWSYGNTACGSYQTVLSADSSVTSQHAVLIRQRYQPTAVCNITACGIYQTALSADGSA